MRIAEADEGIPRMAGQSVGGNLRKSSGVTERGDVGIIRAEPCRVTSDLVPQKIVAGWKKLEAGDIVKLPPL